MKTDPDHIVRAARGWIGTAFHHQGRLKASGNSRGGVDCLGLLIGVAKELGLRDKQGEAFLWQRDRVDYGHLPDADALHSALCHSLHTVEPKDWAEGDVLLMQIDRAPQHLGILSYWPEGGWGVIHALASARKVVEHPLDSSWQQKIVQVFRVTGTPA